LTNAQRTFYALRLGGGLAPDASIEDPNLVQRRVSDAQEEPPVHFAASTFVPEENRIRDTGFGPGQRIITFSRILKHNIIPLPAMLDDIVALAQEGMGAPVEIEFALDPLTENHPKPSLGMLQVRPMGAAVESAKLTVTTEDIRHAFCFSTHALGNALRQDMMDMVFVKPDAFVQGETAAMAAAIGRFNAALASEHRSYLLIGPGRWGSADPFLGIPVVWQDISAVGAIVETSFREIQAEPSQGSHFFHNVTTLGIHYFTIASDPEFIDWEQISQLAYHKEDQFIAQIRLPEHFLLKVDGRSSQGVIVLSGIQS
ncbi:MAG: hypothetical protein ACK2T5_15890, partial [Anaerolineales bacterium]